jgi:hypothetical protein
MKYLPKSTFGAVTAVLYLLLVFTFMVAGLSSGGGHPNPSALFLDLVLILTLPTSWLALAMMNYLNPAPPVYTSPERLSMIFIFAVCAVINAAVIYLLVGFVSRGVRSLFAKSAGRLK